MKISWEQYKRYTDCPQAYTWDYRTPILPGDVGNKDTQYLIKGHTVQELVGRWLQFPALVWGGDNKLLIRQFLDEYLNSTLRKHWLLEQKKGTPHNDFMTIFVELENRLNHILPMIQAHVFSKCGNRPPKQVLRETTIGCEIDLGEALGLGLRVDLEAITDIQVLTPEDEVIVYEGKNTKYPHLVTPHQVWWQTIIMFLSIYKTLESNARFPIYSKIANTHYLAYYHINLVREVPIFYLEGNVQYALPAISSWIKNERDPQLRALIEGNAKATPERSICRLCHHRFRCPYKWTPPQSLDTLSGKGGVETHVI